MSDIGEHMYVMLLYRVMALIVTLAYKTGMFGVPCIFAP